MRSQSKIFATFFVFKAKNLKESAMKPQVMLLSGHYLRLFLLPHRFDFATQNHNFLNLSDTL